MVMERLSSLKSAEMGAFLIKFINRRSKKMKESTYEIIENALALQGYRIIGQDENGLVVRAPDSEEYFTVAIQDAVL
jgi:hypothetical protein